MDQIPVGMEMFNATDESQRQIIERTIRESDFYIVIVAHRYGSKLPNGISFTEMEYNYATEQEIPCMRFIIDDKAPWLPEFIDNTEQDREALFAFKNKLKNKICSFWNNEQELATRFVTTLSKMMGQHDRPGLVRPDFLQEPGQIQIQKQMRYSTYGYSTKANDISYSELIKNSKELRIVMTDGYNWIKKYAKQLEIRINRVDTITQILLSHPNSPSLVAICQRSGKSEEQQLNDINIGARHIASLVHEKSDGGGVKIYGHNLSNSYCLVMSESVAIVIPYLLKSGIGDQVPLFLYNNIGDSKELYDMYSADFQRIWREVEYKAEYELQSFFLSYIVKSPMAGTFYRAARPGSRNFVEIGQFVKMGDTLCIIESMKILNEIEADKSGTIASILVENAEPVEYGQSLFIINELNKAH